MNFLTHLCIADMLDDSLVGQFLGDFVKGRQVERYSPKVRSAILFHRRIDSFSDAHAATRASRGRFSKGRRRFAGVIVDVCYDHFLARHWAAFRKDALADFVRRAYDRLRANRTLFNEHQVFIVDRMIAYDWLGSYYHLAHVGTALDRIASRLTRGDAFVGSIAEIKVHYHALEADFLWFFPELIEFSKDYKGQGG